MANYLRVRNWDRFQHYKRGRGVPPWIRLYSALLDDPSYYELPDQLQLQVVQLFLLAGRLDNLIPDDSEWIRKRLPCRAHVDVDVLVGSGFIERCESSVSKSILTADPMFTYFIQSTIGGCVKIGRAKDPGARLKDLQTASPLPLVLIGVLPGDREYEFHSRFSSSRKHGEWFFLSEELSAFLTAEFAAAGQG